MFSYIFGLLLPIILVRKTRAIVEHQMFLSALLINDYALERG